MDRRAMLVGAGACLISAGGSAARAQVQDRYINVMRKLMAKTWYGKSRIAASGIEGDEFVSDLTWQFQLNSDWTFTGRQVESFRLDGTDHRGIARIQGKCWVVDDKAGLAITGMQVESGTSLPSPLFWSSSKGEMHFYNDADRNGHFILRGTLTDDNDGSPSRVELIDAD